MNIAITGATGFIGSKLVGKLNAYGHKLRCLVRNPDKIDRINKTNVEIFKGDLSDTDSLKGFLEDVDTVFHIAAYVSDWGKKDDFYKINVEATRYLLEQSLKEGVRTFVHMSSSTVVWRSSLFEMHKLEDIDEDYPYPDKHYDYYNETKAESEKLVRKYNSRGINTVIIRPSNVWGDGDNVILPRLLEAAGKGILHPVGYGEKTVTPCNVNNLVNAMVSASNSKNTNGEIYFINDGIKVDYQKFLQDQLGAAGIDWKPGITIPYTFMYILAYLMEIIYQAIDSEKPPVLTRFAVSALAGSRSYSIEKAKRDFGYVPVVGYDEGMKKLSDWINELGGAKNI